MGPQRTNGCDDRLGERRRSTEVERSRLRFAPCEANRYLGRTRSIGIACPHAADSICAVRVAQSIRRGVGNSATVAYHHRMTILVGSTRKVGPILSFDRSDLRMQKTLDEKLARIVANPSCNDFILADAKDADMAYGVAAPGI